MKLAVLSNINLDLIKNKLVDLNFFSSENVYTCDYGQYLLEFLNTDSFINTNQLDYIFVHLDGQELFKTALTQLNSDESIFQEIDLLLLKLEEYAVLNPTTTIILSNIFFSPFSFATYIKQNNSKKIEKEVQFKIDTFIEKNESIRLFDFSRLVHYHGFKNMFDDKYWYLGRIKYSFDGMTIIAKELKNLINANNGKTKKVLVLDLDNTLWGGVVGEDGLEGIQLSEEGLGKIYRDFQQSIKSLKQLGILLAICSKNNENDALEVFENHPLCVLTKDDFIVKKINWNTKVQNIQEIAQELNLGLNSIVFIDDNPVERKIVKDSLPEVNVVDFPEDVTELNRWFLTEVTYEYFSKVSLTNEDISKIDQYKNNIKRFELKQTLNMNDFIASLNINLILHKNKSHYIQRAAQLTQKTNQFNVTVNRYTENELKTFTESDDYSVYLLEYEDKFGNEGIVGEIIINKQTNPKIDVFLMSCRVIGRGVEFSFLSSVLGDLKAEGYEIINANYQPSDKNAQVKDLYKKSFFHVIEENNYTGQIKDILEQNKQNHLPMDIKINND